MRFARLLAPLRFTPILFAVIFFAILLPHLPLLRLPYFWDEAGYYIPAARDLLLSGSLIPHSTLSNAHPPLVMAWLALCWKVIGYDPLVTRTAMLVLAALCLLGVFRLAEIVANTQVAIASTLCVALYPVFFAQSSLAQVDLAAAGLTMWGLSAYVERRARATVFWFSVAALAKETAIIAPLALAVWEALGWVARKRQFGKFWLRLERNDSQPNKSSAQWIGSLLLSALPLALWYFYHYWRTGYVFGNPEFVRYNISSTLSATRFLIVLLLRIWQAVAYLHLWLLTLAALLAMGLLPPVEDLEGTRPRIALPAQMAFYVVIATYVVTMALIGGAVLARYMLPAIPLVIILCVSTLWRRLTFWRAIVACIALAFVAGWFSNPPYGFSPEDNLAYRDYIVLHENAERFLEARYPMARVLTAWPASDEITRPWLGYISRPMRVVRIENFSLDEMISAAELRPQYDIALVFSTKYEPGPRIWDHWQAWTRIKSRYFDFHRDLPPIAASHILGGKIVFSEQKQGQWVAVIELEPSEIQNAERNNSAEPGALTHLRQCVFSLGGTNLSDVGKMPALGSAGRGKSCAFTSEVRVAAPAAQASTSRR
jgi:hypothetical protein